MKDHVNVKSRRKNKFLRELKGKNSCRLPGKERKYNNFEFLYGKTSYRHSMK